MSLPWFFLLSISGFALVFTAFLLQLIALSTFSWATYTSRVDLGKPPENGHYGLWGICSTKGPHFKESCDSMDTFFQIPPYSEAAGIISIIHLFILMMLLFFAALWAIHVSKKVETIFIRPKTICLAKVSVAFISGILAILTAIFATVEEHHPAEYTIKKGWSFWIQVSVIVLDIIITLVFVVENVKFWKHFIRDQIDPEGTRAETYGNPNFDTDSPDPVRSCSGATLAITESSGNPYESVIVVNGATDNENMYFKSSGKRLGDFDRKHSKKKEQTCSVLTYENESFQEHSPSSTYFRN